MRVLTSDSSGAHPPTGWEEIGQRVRSSRLALGMNTQELAEGAGLTRPIVEQIESGTTRFDERVLTRLAEALHVPLSHLLTAPPPAMADVTPDEDSGRTYRSGIVLARWLHDIRQLQRAGLLDLRPWLLSALDAEQALGSLRARWDEPKGSLSWACEQAGVLVAVAPLAEGVEAASLVDGMVAAVVLAPGQSPQQQRNMVAAVLLHLATGDGAFRTWRTDRHMGDESATKAGQLERVLPPGPLSLVPERFATAVRKALQADLIRQARAEEMLRGVAV